MHIPELVRIHSIGYDLKDVKVEFKRELKLDVSSIKIEGKQGEILNVPRWAANVLESEKHVEIQDEDMVVQLKQALEKEKMLGEFDLPTLSVNSIPDPYFYIKLKSYMKRLPEKDCDRIESMLNKLLRTRQSKIIRLADSSKLTAEISKKLSIEEREFYNQVHEISTKFTKTIMGDKK